MLALKPPRAFKANMKNLQTKRVCKNGLVPPPFFGAPPLEVFLNVRSQWADHQSAAKKIWRAHTRKSTFPKKQHPLFFFFVCVSPCIVLEGKAVLLMTSNCVIYLGMSPEHCEMKFFTSTHRFLDATVAIIEKQKGFKKQTKHKNK